MRHKPSPIQDVAESGSGSGLVFIVVPPVVMWSDGGAGLTRPETVGVVAVSCGGVEVGVWKWGCGSGLPNWTFDEPVWFPPEDRA
jgi:hypothetical protein